MSPDLQHAVRRAVARGDFTRARHLWEQYAGKCREEVRQGNDPAGKLEEARQLMLWCRRMALAARAQAQAQLDNLAQRTRVAAAYGNTAIPRPGSIRAARY